MSIFGLIDKQKLDPGAEGVAAPSTDFGDVFGAAFDATARNYLSVSKGIFFGRERLARDKSYNEATGRNIYDDAFNNAPNRDELFDLQKRGTGQRQINEAVDAYLARVRKEDPDRYGQIRTTSEIEEKIQNDAKAAAFDQAKTVEGATRFNAIAGQLAGGLAAGVMDPVNIATIPIGAGLSSGIMKTILIEAGLNAGAEVATFPMVKEWQEELGQEYGAEDLAWNMGVAALFGAAVGGAGKAASIGLERMANSAKLARAQEALQTIRDGEALDIKNAVFRDTEKVNELFDALSHETRRLHIEESNIGRYLNEEIAPDLHMRALREIDDAINEGRAPNFRKLEVSDDIVRALDRTKMDPAMARVFDFMTDQSPLKIKEPEVTQSFRPLGADEMRERLDMFDTPEYKAYEARQFEATFPQEKLGERVSIIDDDGIEKELTIAQLKERFADENSFMDAINSCGIGGA